MPGFAFCGHDFLICGKTALFWPARSALLVADLHLEKASWFAARGQMLPPQESLATLDRLAALIGETQAREIWCLGDNFHDAEGAARMPNVVRAALLRMTDGVDWHWITGNHDEGLAAQIGGRIIEEALVDGLLLRHRADPADGRAELSGHYHPKHRIATRGRAISRACFVMGASKLILPAFGALTGGLAADHPEILSAVGKPARALMAVQGRVASFGLRGH